jgi:acyl transferase domain-containing protein
LPFARRKGSRVYGGKEKATDPVRSTLLPVSGEDSRSLVALAERYDAALADGAALTDLAYTAGALGSHHALRRAVVVDDPTAAREWLAEVRGDAPPAPAGGTGPVAFVFSGQGNQSPGMGIGLYSSEPVARAALDECDAVLRRVAGWSLLDAFADVEAMSADPAVLQPALVALQIAVTRQLAHWGLVADAYVGHSLGEIPAAVAAGLLSLTDALELAVVRGALMREAEGTGRTALLGVPAERATGLIAAAGGDAEIAGWNAPGSTLIAGDAACVHAVVAGLAADDVFARVLPGTVAFHSSRVASVAKRLPGRLGALTPLTGEGLFVSTVTGEPLGQGKPDAGYWGRNVRLPVRFQQAVGHLAARGYRTFVEIGAHPSLTPALRDCLAGGPALVVPTLTRGVDERNALLATAGLIYEAGGSPDFSAIAPAGRRPLRFPTPAVVPPGQLFADSRMWAARIRRESEPGRFGWRGRPLASFALAAGAALNALTVAGDRRRVTVRLEVGAPLLAGAADVCTAVPSGVKTVDVRLGHGDSWTHQATASLDDTTGGSCQADLAAALTRCPSGAPANARYAVLARLGLTPAAQIADRIRSGPDGEVVIRLKPMPPGAPWSLVDVMVHGAVLAAAGTDAAELPFACTALHLPGRSDAAAAAWLLLGAPEADGSRRAQVLDPDGRVLAEADRLVLQRVTPEILTAIAGLTTGERPASDPVVRGPDPVELAALEPPERARVIGELIRAEVGHVLRVRPALIDPARALNHLGVDSIMGLELQRRLEALLRTEIKVVQLLRGESIDELAHQLAGTMATPAPEIRADGLDDPRELERLLAEMDDMSGDDIDALLQRLSDGTVKPS